MFKFLAEYTPRKLSRDIVIAVLTAAVTRIWFWIIQVPLDIYREVAFWAIAPISGLMMVALAAYVRGQLNEQPNVTGKIDHVQVAPFLKLENANRCQIFMIVALRNTGMPSSVDSWELTVQPQGSSAPRTAALVERMDIEVIGRSGIGELSASEILYDRAMKPIAKGKILRGYLHFQYEQRADVVARPGTVFTLSWEDVTGKRNSTQYTWDDSPGQSLADGSFPGLKSHRLIKNEDE